MKRTVVRALQTVSLVLVLAAVSGAGAFAKSSEKKSEEPKNVLPPGESEILCERAPTAYLVSETRSKTGDICESTAKIQAIAYECGDPTDTYTFAEDALQKNIDKVKERCDRFCEDLSWNCTGYIDEPSSCGLRTPSNRSLEIGKKIVHCPKHCKGQAFNYCSIFHGNFFSTSASLFKNIKDNCHCRRK